MERLSKRRIYCITCKKRIKEKDLWGVMPILSESDPSGYAGYQCAKCWGNPLKEHPLKTLRKLL